MGTGEIVAEFNGENAMRLVLLFVVLVLAGSVMACGSGGVPSAAPSAQASAETPSASAAPASPSPSPSAVPSQPTVAPSTAIDLAALLPSVLAGTTLKRGNDDVTFPSEPDPASDMGRMLGAVGASSADIRMASAYDPSGTLPVEIIALAFAGVSGDQIATALDSVYAGGPDREIEALEMAGTRVLRITAAADGTSRYVFVDGDVLFLVVGADEALATEAVTAIAR